MNAAEPQTTRVTPAMLVGAAKPGGGKAPVSPEAEDLLNRIGDFLAASGKASAARNYVRHSRGFIAWAESRGHNIRSLPPESVEQFLADLRAAGTAEATIHIMRGQIRNALRIAHENLGADFGHIMYQTGKPPDVRRAEKEREKLKNRARKQAQTIAQAQAILAAQNSGLPMPRPDVPQFTPPADPIDSTGAYPEEASMPAQTTPESAGAPAAGGSAPAPQPIIVNMPAQPSAPLNPQRPLATIGAPRPNPQMTPARTGILIQNHTFTGPYVRISRLEDGTNPLTPPGTETYVTTVPLAQLAPHGDVAAYLQKFIVPNLPLSPLTSQVHFVLAELNDRRGPTGRRDELVVGKPITGHAAVDLPMGGPVAPQPSYGFAGMPAAAPTNPANDYWVRKLDEDAAEAKKRAEKLEEQLSQAKDAQTNFMLMQALQRENDLRRELEAQKREAIERASRAEQFAAAPPPAFAPPMPMFAPEPPRADATSEVLKAVVEGQNRLFEALLAKNTAPAAPAPDPMTNMLPFIAQLNQQSQAIQQSNQQMLVQIMQSNQQFMQTLLAGQLQEVKAAANAPKADELETFAEKLQKMKMVSDMLGGGGGGGTSLIGELIANSESIGAGIAKVIESAQPKPANAPAQLNGAPQPAGALPAPKGPPEPIAKAHAKIVAAVKAQDDERMIVESIEMIRALTEMPEPFPKLAERLLNAFKSMEDPAEMYVFAKSFWELAQAKPEKALVKALADCLVRWYDVVHEQLFGAKKELGAAESTTGESEETDDESDDESDETDDGTEESGETAGEEAR